MNRRVIYCHGLPGSPEELSAFATPLRHDVQGLERLGRCEGSYEARVLSAFDDLGVKAPVTIAGFSLGAMSATYIAAKRGHLVGKLILISPAAPLQLGDFLPAMAGRAVFEAAQAGDWALRVFSTSQMALAAFAPKLAVKAMFRRSPDAEMRLLDSPRFVEQVTDGLRTCLGPRQAAYRQELQAYVRPWAHVFREVRCDTEIWSGADDDWTPPGMSAAYKEQLGDLASLNVCSGLGHYSTLRAALSSLH
jgi:pimeloyl-ACP methyl ester carboxylesterase